MWKCKQCNEEIENTFDVCWNCGTSKEGTASKNIDEFKKAKEEIAEEIKHLKRKSIGEILFSFKGRICRSEYWVKAFPILFVYHILVWLIVNTETNLVRRGISILLFSLISLWPSLAVSTKRLHDRNRSGLLLSTLLLPVLGIIFEIRLITFFGIIFCIWLIIEMWFLKGTEGENRYGPDPLNKLEDLNLSINGE